MMSATEYSLCAGSDCRDMVCGEIDRMGVEGLGFLQRPSFCFFKGM